MDEPADSNATRDVADGEPTEPDSWRQGPGIDAEKYFKERLQFNGGQVTEALRVPLRNPDFSGGLVA